MLGIFNYSFARAALLAVLYWVAVKISVELVYPVNKVALFWPPNAIAAAFLLFSTRRDWPIYIVAMAAAYFAARVPGGQLPLIVYVGFCIANIVEVLFISIATNRYADMSASRANIGRVLFVIAMASIPAALISAIIAGGFISAAVESALYWEASLGWFTGNLSGLLLTLPLLISWTTSWNVAPSIWMGGRRVESVILLTLLFGISIAFAAYDPGEYPIELMFPYFVFPLLIWAGLRLDDRVTTLAILIVGLSAILLTFLGQGPFQYAGISGFSEIVLMKAGLITISMTSIILLGVVRNWKKAEAELQNSSERFAAMIESAGDAIYIHDRYGNISDVNQTACDQTGYSRHDLTNMNVQQLDAAIDFENLREIWDLGEADPANYPLTLESAHRRKDGTTFPMEARISLLPSEEHGYLFVAMVRDVMKRKEFEKQLVESEKKYRDSINSTLEGYWLVDVDGRIVEVNNSFCNMLERSRDELIGRRSPEFTAEENRTLHEQNISQIRYSEQRQCEVTFITKSGHPVFTKINATSIFDDDGEATGAFAFISNITKERLAEQKLAAKIKELDFQKSALDHHAIVSITDTKGNITYANDKFCKISGYSREELIGKNHRIVKSGDHSKEFFNNLWKTISSGKVWNGEIKNLKNEGGFYWVDATIVPFLGSDGKPFQYISIRTDITERVEAQRLAETANLTKSEFLSSMSHELRTPMNAILGFAQLLEFNPKEPLTEAQKGCVEHIMKGGNHLLSLINDILDLARIEAGKVDVSIVDISPTAILDECLTFITGMAEKRGIDISIPDATVKIPRVLADYTRFKQVLLNFMSNAVKYNRENGSLTITFEETENMLRINVTDTGEGIPEDKQKELFKPFSRLGAENTEIEGTGIGLVVCKDLVELMHGTVGLESEVGRGSTFWFTLPLAEHNQDEVITQTKDAIVRMGGNLSSINGTLLYVEDNLANLQLMELIVSRIEGLEMVSTHTGELGIEMARSEKPDVIILDINLPGMNGIEVLKKLHSFEETKNIPVLALSANATERDIEKGMEAGFLQYLTKPVNIPVLVEAIKKARDNAR